MSRDSAKRNLCMTVAYDGSAFLGWQENEQRDGLLSVQTCLEETLSKVTGEEIKIIGAGRTDRGVHARGQRANFYTSIGTEAEELRRQSNLLLPETIKITNLEQAAATFHSRYDAVLKEYVYRIAYGERPSVFHRHYVYHCAASLDFGRMEEAARQLVGTHDFRFFSSVRDETKDTVRTLYEIKIERKDRKELAIIFRGDGFLYHMVRILAGTLFEAGRDRLQLSDIRKAMQADGKQAAPMLPAQGLTLERICYDWEGVSAGDGSSSA